MPNFLFPTHATETLEQTLGNATIAANTSVETAQSIGYAASNASTILTTANTGIKALSVGYGVALTGASALDAFTARNTCSRCLFGIGCCLGAVGTVSSTITAFNISTGLAPVALVSGAAGSAFYWLGRKANAIARIADIPAV
jgi:hypothetical protein